LWCKKGISGEEKKTTRMDGSGNEYREIGTAEKGTKQDGRKAAISDCYDRTSTSLSLSLSLTHGAKQIASTANYRMLRKPRLKQTNKKANSVA
jgi:hypothetical protein